MYLTSCPQQRGNSLLQSLIMLLRVFCRFSPLCVALAILAVRPSYGATLDSQPPAPPAPPAVSAGEDKAPVRSASCPITIYNAAYQPCQVVDLQHPPVPMAIWVAVGQDVYYVAASGSIEVIIERPTQFCIWEDLAGWRWDCAYTIKPGSGPYTVENDRTGGCAGFGYDSNLTLYQLGQDLLIDFIDPRTRLMLSNGENIWDDHDFWAASTDLREGVAADGLTRLVIRIPVRGGYTHAEVQIEATDGEGGDIGALSLLDGGSPGAMVSLPIVTVGAKRYAFGLYRAPREFIRSDADVGRTEREVVVKLTIEPSNLPGCLEGTLRLRRPPVALVHGVWSSADEAFPIETQEMISAGGKRTVWAQDYYATNNLGYDLNAWVVPEAIETAMLLEQVYNNVAVTRADVVAHSMGGILTRLYSQDDEEYRRPETYGEGDVHRLVEITTPNIGTPVADLIYEMIGLPGASFVKAVEKKVTTKPKGFHGGALRDLRWASPALRQLRDFERPSHAIYAASNSESILGSMERVLWWFLPRLIRTALDKSGDPRDVFCHEFHDWIVPIRSQQGGKTCGFSWAGFATSHTQAIEAAVPGLDALLDVRIDDESGTWGCPFTTNANVQAVFCPPTTSQVPILAARANPLSVSLSIVEPTDGQVVVPGEQVQVTVQVGNAPPGVGVAVLGDGLFEELPVTPFVVTWTIPSDAIGTVDVVAFAADDSLIYGVSSVVELAVSITEPPTVLELRPGVVQLGGPNDLAPLSLIGSWANGVERDITQGDLGTTYESSNPSIVRITQDGVAIAVGQGSASVTARYGLQTATTDVSVIGDSPVTSPDQFAPQILFDACPDTLALGTHAAIDVTVVDELSGVESQSASNGAHDLDTSTLGPHTFSVTARDFLGHESTERCDYYVHSEPTAVIFGGFDAAIHGDGAKLSWRVTQANGLEGFNIYRTSRRGSQLIRVNANPLNAETREYVDDRLEPGAHYTYRVGAIDQDGEFLSPSQDVSIPVRPLALNPAWPNPATGPTEISFYLPESADVELTLYDVAGRRVRTLVSERRTFGSHTISWDGKSASGLAMPSGVYFSRLNVNGRVLSRKIVIAR